jgi:Dna[CI] antecedent, DciA
MYNDTKTTSKHIRHVLPKVLAEIADNHRDRPDLILMAWPEVIGEKLAPMTEAVSFNEGVMVVTVKNSTLYSLLSQHEKKRLLHSLKEKFPSITIRDLHFRIGSAKK